MIINYERKNKVEIEREQMILDNFLNQLKLEPIDIAIKKMIEENETIKLLNEKVHFLDFPEQYDDIYIILLDIVFHNKKENIEKFSYSYTLEQDQFGIFQRRLIDNSNFKPEIINEFKGNIDAKFSALDVNNLKVGECESKIKTKLDKYNTIIENFLSNNEKLGLNILNVKAILTQDNFEKLLLPNLLLKAQEKFRKIVYANSVLLNSEWMASFGNQNVTNSIISKLKNASLLIIDKMSANNTPKWLLGQILSQILVFRNESKLKTIFISNFTKEEFDMQMLEALNYVNKKGQEANSNFKNAKIMSELQFDEFKQLFEVSFEELIINKDPNGTKK